MKYDIPSYYTLGWVVPLTPDVFIALDERIGFVSHMLKHRKYNPVRLMSFEITPWQDQFKLVFYGVEFNDHLKQFGFFENLDSVSILFNDIPLKIRQEMIRIPEMTCTQHYYDGGAEADELRKQQLTMEY